METDIVFITSSNEDIIGATTNTLLVHAMIQEEAIDEVVKYVSGNPHVSYTPEEFTREFPLA